MKRNVVFGSVGVALVAMASAALAGDKTKSEQAFDRLTSLQSVEQKAKSLGFERTDPRTVVMVESVSVPQKKP